MQSNRSNEETDATKLLINILKLENYKHEIKNFNRTLSEKRKNVLTNIAKFIQDNEYSDAPTFQDIAKIFNTDGLILDNAGGRMLESRARAFIHKLKESDLVDIIDGKSGKKVVVLKAYEFVDVRNESPNFKLWEYFPKLKIDSLPKDEKCGTAIKEKNKPFPGRHPKQPNYSAISIDEGTGGKYKGFVDEWTENHSIINSRLKDVKSSLKRADKYAESNSFADEIIHLEFAQKMMSDIEQEVVNECKVLDHFLDVVNRKDAEEIKKTADCFIELAGEYTGKYSKILEYEGKSYLCQYYASRLNSNLEYEESMENIRLAIEYAEEVSKYHPIGKERYDAENNLHYFKSLEYYHYGDHTPIESIDDWNKAKELYNASLKHIHELIKTKNNELKEYAQVMEVIIQSTILHLDAEFTEENNIAIKLRKEAYKLLYNSVQRFGNNNDFQSFYHPFLSYYFEEESEIINQKIEFLEKKIEEIRNTNEKNILIAEYMGLVKESISQLENAIKHYKIIIELSDDEEQADYFKVRLLLDEAIICSKKAELAEKFTEEAEHHKKNSILIKQAIEIVNKRGFKEWSFELMEINAQLECIEYYQSLAKANLGNRLKIAEYYDKASEIYKQLAEMFPENELGILKNSLCRKAHAFLNKGLEHKDIKLFKEAEDTIKKMRKEYYFEDCEECLKGIQKSISESTKLKNIEQYKSSEIKCSVILPFHFVEDN